MNQRIYPLDTSAIRALPSRVFAHCREHGVGLRVSPVSFWEMLCHLDEGDFRRNRGNLRKCSLSPMLEEPFAAHGVAVGAGVHVHPTRFQEPEIIGQLLHLIENSETLQEYYRREVVYADGGVGLISGCSERARETLLQEEKRFVMQMYRLEDEVRRFFPYAKDGELSDHDFCRMVRSGAESLSRRYALEDGCNDPDLPQIVFNSIFAHSGLMLSRVLDRLRRGPPARYDGNDTEDSYIAFHLDLSRPRTIVTADKGVLLGLSRAFNALRTHEGREPACGVMSVVHFLQEVVPQ